jgi:hypothetical protein
MQMTPKILLIFLIFLTGFSYAQVNNLSLLTSEITFDYSSSEEVALKPKIKQDTLKLIFEKVTELCRKWDLQDSLIKEKYIVPIENYKKLHEKDSLNFIGLNKRISDLEKEKDQQLQKEELNKKNNDQQKITIENQKKVIDDLALLVNDQITTLQNAPYNLDVIWIGKLLTTCNGFSDKSKITNFAMLTDFKTKSEAIDVVMKKINTTRFLNQTQIETIKKDLQLNFGQKNNSLVRLNTDYDKAIELLDEYLNTFCIVSQNIENVMGLGSYKDYQKKEALEGKCHNKIMMYPMLQTVIAEVIKSGYTVNPLKGKIDCE